MVKLLGTMTFWPSAVLALPIAANARNGFSGTMFISTENTLRFSLGR